MKNICDVINEFMYSKKELIGIEINSRTYNTYIVRQKAFNQFLTNNDLSIKLISEIKISTIKKYDIWLRSNKKLTNDYIMKMIQWLDMLLNYSVINDYINSNPCDLYSYRYNRHKKRNYISYSDLEKIESFEPLRKQSRFLKPKDLFVFMSYTGLSYSDVMNFEYSKNVYKNNGIEWISIKRQKTSSETLLPLLPKAKEILVKHNFKLPKLTNEKLNSYLKEIAEILNITTQLSSSSARKTFGMIMHNDYGVPIDTVSKMLGHTSISTTQTWYVDTAQGKIMIDMKPVLFKLSENINL